MKESNVNYSWLFLCRKHWFRYNEPRYYQERLEELNNNKKSSLHCFKSFFTNGLTPEESITLNSIKKSIASYLAHFSGSISKYKDGWKEFTVRDCVTNELFFSEHKFYTPTIHLLEFQKEFSKIQLISSYFEDKKNHDRIKELHAAQFIADWVWFNWRKINKKNLWLIILFVKNIVCYTHFSIIVVLSTCSFMKSILCCCCVYPSEIYVAIVSL